MVYYSHKLRWTELGEQTGDDSDLDEMGLGNKKRLPYKGSPRL